MLITKVPNAERISPLIQAPPTMRITAAGTQIRAVPKAGRTETIAITAPQNTAPFGFQPPSAIVSATMALPRTAIARPVSQGAMFLARMKSDHSYIAPSFARAVGTVVGANCPIFHHRGIAVQRNVAEDR